MDLLYKAKNGWEETTREQQEEIFSFSEGYKSFLDRGKTERECVIATEELAKKAGFVPLHSVKECKPGDKVYAVNHRKNILLAVIGEQPLTEGIRLVAAHIDSPRLDLKQNPLYEDLDLGLFKTHYYGGIKKYQWTAIPLAIHGLMIRQDGSRVEITIGEDEGDPVFTITDLLPHLAADQMQKKMSEGITGEGLNVLIGSLPGKEEKDKVKTAIMTLLNEKYGIVEEDFLCAEVEVVPAFRARDLGFDRSMIAAYGQDDRVCAYTALQGILETSHPQKTAVCLLADKEEVGSMGVTGMKSRFFENALAEIQHKITGYDGYGIRRCLMNSLCLSADVGAAMDPNFKEVSEANNAPRLGGGLMVTKYTGSRGKGGSSDADAELLARLRSWFADGKVHWQIGELGKVDQGGGGTVAQYIADLGVDTVDAGVPLFSMHSPFEVSSKYDVFQAYRGYKVFYNYAE